MFAPNGFVPSNAIRDIEYDQEGRLRTHRVNSRADDDAGIAESNSFYATDAELFGTLAPFIKKNRIRDAERRNYIIQPGGACIYFEEDTKLEDPYGNGRVQFTGPSEKESFGGNKRDGTKFGADNRGRAFTVGQAGPNSTGPGR